MECSDKRYPESYLSTWYRTSQPAYDATSTESNGVKIDGFLYPNSKKVSKKGDFLVQGSDGGGTFRLLFWNLHKVWNPSILTPSDGQRCIIG